MHKDCCSAQNENIYSSEQIDKDIIDYTKAIMLNPLDESAYKQRAKLYMETECYANAIEDFSKVIDINPQETEYLRERSRAFLFLGLNDNALLDMIKAVELLPNEQNYVYLSIVYSYMQEYEKAIYNLDKAIEINPEEPEYYYTKGWYYSLTNKHYEAIMNYTDSINLDKKCPHFKFHARAYSYAVLEQFENAIKDETRALEVSPENTIYYYWRGLFNYKAQNYESALSDFKMRLDSEKNDHCAYFETAKIYYKLAQYDKALENCDIAIKLDDSHFLHYLLKAEIFNKLNNPREAEFNYSKAIEYGYNEQGDIEW